MRYILFLLLTIGIALSGCVEERQRIEKITEYQIIEISIQHEENAFMSTAEDYISVIYLDENGVVEQQKDTYLGGLTVVLGNTTKFEKYEIVDQHGSPGFLDFKYVLTVANYSLIQNARRSN